MLKPANFPIPTYESFEEENKNAEEEEKIDFFTSLMEGMAKLKPGEQMWIQIRARPIYYTSPDGAKFVKDGQHLRDVLAKRIDEKKANLTPLWKELIDFIMHGASAAEEKPQELFPAEMRLTAAERETVEAVEKNTPSPSSRAPSAIFIWANGMFGSSRITVIFTTISIILPTPISIRCGFGPKL